MLCQCANCRTPYSLCQCDILATRCSIPTSCVASRIAYHMLCQCVITSHRDTLSHVTYCRTSARELWAHPPPPTTNITRGGRSSAYRFAARLATLRSKRSVASLIAIRCDPLQLLENRGRRSSVCSYATHLATLRSREEKSSFSRRRLEGSLPN